MVTDLCTRSISAIAIAPEIFITHTSANFEILKSDTIFLKQIIILKSLNSVF